MLAAGIAEAMNCTAFGLIVAIPALLAFALLSAKMHALVDEIDQAALHVFNIIVDVKEGFVRPTDKDL